MFRKINPRALLTAVLLIVCLVVAFAQHRIHNRMIQIATQVTQPIIHRRSDR